LQPTEVANIVIVYDRSKLHLERHDTPVGTSDDEVDFVGASVGS